MVLAALAVLLWSLAALVPDLFACKGLWDLHHASQILLVAHARDFDSLIRPSGSAPLA